MPNKKYKHPGSHIYIDKKSEVFTRGMESVDKLKELFEKEALDSKQITRLEIRYMEGANSLIYETPDMPRIVATFEARNWIVRHNVSMFDSKAIDDGFRYLYDTVIEDIFDKL